MWDKNFEEILRGYLRFLEPGEALLPDADLWDLGLDSLGTVDLLADIEDAYGVRFLDDELDLENFATAGVLWGVVSQLVGAPAA